MVASSNVVALAANAFIVAAGAVGFAMKHDLIDGKGLAPREVTVTVTYCPADTSAPVVPPIYTTANLPPLESSSAPISSTASMVPPGGETGGSTPAPTSSYTPFVPIPVTPTDQVTTETANLSSTSVYTPTTGTGTEVVSSTLTTPATTAMTTHPVSGSSATHTPSPTTSATSTTGAANAVSLDIGLVVLVALAAMA